MTASSPPSARSKIRRRGQRAEMTGETLRLGGEVVLPGTTARIELRVARLFTGTWLSLPVSVFNGAEAGPRLWLDAAIHGDELNGMEIINRVLARLDPTRMRGSVVAVPVVNVFGFVQQDRYLPDRRDLNRSFPGSTRGSTAARLADLFMKEVVHGSQYGIDLHTGSLHRINLPQIRAHLEDPETRRIAEAFGAPMMYQAKEIGGSLRAAARKGGAHILVYEAGGPLRFDPGAIEVGVAGVLRVLRALDIWQEAPGGASAEPSFEARQTRWLRASRSGIFYLGTELGVRVKRNQVVGRVVDLFSQRSVLVRSSVQGMVIGYTVNPLVHQGDALVHVAVPAPL